MNISTGNITSPEVHPATNLTSLDLLTWDLRTSILCINLLVGFPTHSYVLWLIVTGRGIALEFFNFNLTVCEIIYSLNSLAYVLLLRFPSLIIAQRVLQTLVMTGRPLFQCLISVERYLAVIHPVTFLKYKPVKYKAICSAVVWIISFVPCLGRIMTFLLLDMNVFIWGFSIIFLILLPIQLFCLAAVLRALKQSGPGERGREREEENYMKKRAFHLILITTVTMIMMFVPYIITGFLSVLGKQDVSVGWFFSISCFVVTAYVQPVLYLHRDGKPCCCFSATSAISLKQNN